MADKPKFDPSKPFVPAKEVKPAFDPNQPFDEVKKKEFSVSSGIESPSKSTKPAEISVDLATPKSDVPVGTIETPTQSVMPQETAATTIQPTTNEPNESTRYLQGFAKSFNTTLSDIFRKADYAQEKVLLTLGTTIFGKESEQGLKAIMDNPVVGGRPFKATADLIDKTSEGAADVPDNVVGGVVAGVGSIIPDILGAALTPEVKVGSWLAKYGVQGVDKFAMYLAGKEGTAAVQESEGGTPKEQILAPLEGAAEGFTMGLLFNSFGKISSKVGESVAGKLIKDPTTYKEALNKAILQGGAATLTNSLAFGGYAAAEEFAKTGTITSKNVATNVGIGMALGAKDLGKLAFVRGLSSFIATPTEGVNKVAQSNTTPEEMKAMSDESLAAINKKIGEIKQEPIDQKKLDENITEAQKRLGLPQVPDVVFSDNTNITLNNLREGLPVTNELLESASQEIYSAYKGLQGVRESSTRKFTTDQIEKPMVALEGIITTLENAKTMQIEKESFLAENDKLVVQAAVDENLANLKAFTEEVVNNPKGVIESITESTLPEPAKAELVAKVKQVASDNDPKNIEAKPITEQIDKLNQEIIDIEGSADHPAIKEQKKAAVNEKLKIANEQLKEIISPETPTVAEKPTEVPTEPKTTPNEKAEEKGQGNEVLTPEAESIDEYAGLNAKERNGVKFAQGMIERFKHYDRIVVPKMDEFLKQEGVTMEEYLKYDKKTKDAFDAKWRDSEQYKFVDENYINKPTEELNKEVENQPTTLKTEAEVKAETLKSEPIKATFKSAADKLRSYKIQEGLDNPTTQGISDTKLWNDAIDVAADIIETTGDYAQALSNGMAKLKTKEEKDKFATLINGLKEEPKPQEPFAVKLESLQSVRDEFGLGERVKETRSDAEVERAAQKLIDEGANVNEYIERVKKGGALSTDEQVVMRKLIGGLKQTAKTDADFLTLKNAIEAEELARAESGRSLRQGRITEPVESSVADMIVENMQVAMTDKLTPEQKAINAKEYEALTAAKEEYQKLYEAEQAKVKKLKQNVRSADRELERDIKKNIDYLNRSEKRKQTLDQMKAEREDLSKLFRQQIGQLSAGFDPRLAATAAKIIFKDMEIGGLKLADAVDRFYTEFKDNLKDVTKDDLKEALRKHVDELDAKLPSKTELLAAKRELKASEKALNEADKINKEKEPTTEKERQKRNQRTKQAEDGVTFNKPTPELTKEEKTIKDLQDKLDKLEQGVYETKKKATPSDNQTIKDLRKQIKEHEVTRTKLKQESLKRTLADLENQLETGQFRKPALPPIKPTPEMRAAMDKIIEAREERKLRMERERYNARKWYQKVNDIAYGVLVEAQRQIVATADISATALQAGAAMIARPMVFSRAFKASMKDMISEKTYKRWHEEIKQHPNYYKIKESGVALSDATSSNLSAREEMMAGKLLEVIPGLGKAVKIGGKGYGGIITASSRQYSSILNHIRFDMSNKIIDAMEANGKTIESHPLEYKEMARYVNAFTGRGDLFAMEGAARTLGAIMFAPRMYSAMFQTMTGRSLFKGPAEVKAAAARDYLSYLGGVAAILLLAKGAQTYMNAPVEVELDTRSKDFGFLKFGDTRIGVPGGVLPYLVTMTQLLLGAEKSLTTGEINKFGTDWGQKTRLDVAGRWVRGKLSPPAGLFVDIVSGSTFMGEDVTLEGELLSRAVPMSLQAAVKTANKESFWQGVMDGSISAVGLPTRTIPVTGWYPRQTISYNGKEVNALGESPDKVDPKTWEKLREYEINVSPPARYRSKIKDTNTGESVKMTEEQYINFVEQRGKYISQTVNKVFEQVSQPEIRNGIIDRLMEFKRPDGTPVNPSRKAAEMVLDKVIIPNTITDAIQQINTGLKEQIQGQKAPPKSYMDIYDGLIKYEEVVQPDKKEEPPK